jgi:metal-responsive CopG/Arc/MetJ family transcriptional regulator
MSIAAFNMPGMARPSLPDADKRVIVTIRLPKSLVAKLDSIRGKHEFPPTLTQLIERAVREYIERNTPKDKPKGK